jgi:hypothetical protein
LAGGDEEPGVGISFGLNFCFHFLLVDRRKNCFSFYIYLGVFFFFCFFFYCLGLGADFGGFWGVCFLFFHFGIYGVFFYIFLFTYFGINLVCILPPFCESILDCLGLGWVLGAGDCIDRILYFWDLSLGE